MANTTATFSLNSNDLLTTAPLSISTSNNLLKAGLQIGLDQIKHGVVIADTTQRDIVDATTDGINKANFVYLVNKETDATLYVTVKVGSTVIGRLYAGDWMLLPCNFADASHDITIEASSGTQVMEFAHIHEGENLTAS